MSADKQFEFTSSTFKYAAVELILKEKTNSSVISIKKDDIEVGLFAGMKTDMEMEHVPSIHICLQQGHTMKTFNVEKYNVLSIEAAHAMYKEELFFQANLADQVIAVNCLNELLDILSNHSITSTDGKMLKVEKYTEVPDELAKGTRASSIGSKDISIYSTENSSYNRSGTMYNQNCGYNSKTTYLTPAEKKKLTKPTFFKRGTDAPSKDLLETMKKNIDEIREGSYKQPEFPILTADTVTKNDIDDDTDDDNIYAQNGAWMGIG